MKSKKVLVILLIFLAFAIFFLNSRNNNSCETFDSVEMSIEVERNSRSVIGFNTDTDHLNFGKVSSASTVTRSIIVENSQESNVKVYFEGGFSQWVDVSEAEFTISPGEEHQVTFTVNVPEGAQIGTYNDKVIFCFSE